MTSQPPLSPAEGPRHLSLNLRIWRQASPESPGAFQTYRLEAVSADLSLLEALDLLNEQLVSAGERPVMCSAA